MYTTDEYGNVVECSIQVDSDGEGFRIVAPSDTEYYSSLIEAFDRVAILSRTYEVGATFSTCALSLMAERLNNL